MPLKKKMRVLFDVKLYLFMFLLFKIKIPYYFFKKNHYSFHSAGFSLLYLYENNILISGGPQKCYYYCCLFLKLTVVISFDDVINFNEKRIYNFIILLFLNEILMLVSIIVFISALITLKQYPRFIKIIIKQKKHDAFINMHIWNFCFRLPNC